MAIGVRYLKSKNKFVAVYSYENKQTVIGKYDTEEEAIEARAKWWKENESHYRRLTSIKVNKKKIERINKILAVAFDSMACDIAEKLDESHQLISTDLRKLVEIGYLSYEIKQYGTYKQQTFFYSAKKPIFDMADFDKLLAPENKEVGRPLRDYKKSPDKEPVATIKGARAYGLGSKELKDKYIAQTAHARSEYKSPKNTASSNTMAMF